MRKNVFKYLSVVLILFNCNIIIFPSSNKSDREIADKKEIVAILQGYFTGDIEGDIEKLILYNDYTFAANFKTSYMHAVFSGYYTLDDKNFFSFEGYGEALGAEQDVDISTSKFSAFGKGILDLDQGSGKGNLLFIFDDWNEKDKTDYYLFLYNNPEN